MAKSRFSRPFWLLWLSTIISGLGDGITFIAVPLLAATITREPLLIAAVTVAAKLPWLLVSPITGALTDLVDPRRLLWRVVSLQAVVMALYAVLVGLDAASIPLLMLLAFVMASAETLSSNASAAIVPDLVDKRSLPTANSLVQGGQFVASDFIGLAIGAVLFSAYSALPFTVDAVSFAIAAVLLVGISRSAAPRQSGQVTMSGLRKDIAEGFRWLARHRMLRTLCLIIAMANFAVVGVMSIAVLYALEVLGVSGTTYGLLMIVVAAGGLLGLVGAPFLCARLGLGRTLQITFVLSPIPFLIGAFTSQPVVAAVSFFFVGLSISLGNVASMTLRQSVVPRRLFGRVNASFRLVAVGLGPLGGGFAGLVANIAGLRAPFVIGGVVLVLVLPLALALLSNEAVSAAEREAENFEGAAEPS